MEKTANKRLIRVGHSPDPDDAFMFYALASGRLDSGPFRVEHQLQDIQTLNERARRGELEISAVSIAAYPYVADRYAMLNCGSSMGDGYGPLVVSRRAMTLDELQSVRIAVPGTLTTAFLTLQLLLRGLTQERAEGRGPRAKEQASGTVRAGVPASPAPPFIPPKGGDKGGGRVPPRQEEEVPSALPPGPSVTTEGRFVTVPFDQILQRVATGEFDAGLIIHEGQLTFANQGLHKVVDLGVWWGEQTGLPLPLGGNVIRRDLGERTIRELADLLKRSIEFGLAHREDAVRHALQYARDMGTDLADRFVGMYVNQWTLDYGDRGRAAVNELLRRGHEAGLVPKAYPVTFV